MPSAIVKNSKGLRDRLKQKILVTPRYEKETLLEQEFILNISSLLVIKCRSRIAYFRKFIIIIIIIINIINIITIIIIIFTERKFLKGQFEREKLLLKEESFYWGSETPSSAGFRPALVNRSSGLYPLCKGFSECCRF